MNSIILSESQRLPPPPSLPPPPKLPERDNVLTRDRDEMSTEQEMYCIPTAEDDNSLVLTITVGGEQTISYKVEQPLGRGSFGTLFQEEEALRIASRNATRLETGELVAIKKILQNQGCKNRELQFMRLMDHPNVVSFKHCFYFRTSANQIFLHFVMEYVPSNLYDVLHQLNNAHQKMPLFFVKLYTYQVDPLTHQCKLCDFGSAKVLVKGEPNATNICTRYYRAPELTFGATEYTSSVDIWSAGCVLAELLLGHPIFPGENSVNQPGEIIKILGTPTREEIRCMNPNYRDFNFARIRTQPWHKVFHKRTPPEAIDLVSRLLLYSPSLRCTALEACAHPFFDDLRKPTAHIPNGEPLPALFDFKEELTGASPELINRLIPEHIKREMSGSFSFRAGA